MLWTCTYFGDKPSAVWAQLVHSILSAQEKMMCRSGKNKEWKYLGKTLDIFETVDTFSSKWLSEPWKIRGVLVLWKMETKITNLKAVDPIAKDSTIAHLCLVTVMTNLDSILKSRDITLPAKVRLVKAMVLPVVMYGCESWTVKKAEHWRIDAFELWCWRRLLRVPWTARRSNQSILKEISPGCSLVGLMLKLKLNTLKSWLIGKVPDAGKDWGQEEKGTTEDEMVGWHHRLNGRGFGWTPGVGDGQGGLACCSSWGSKELDRTEWLDWTELA